MDGSISATLRTTFSGHSTSPPVYVHFSISLQSVVALSVGGWIDRDLLLPTSLCSSFLAVFDIYGIYVIMFLEIHENPTASAVIVLDSDRGLCTDLLHRPAFLAGNQDRERDALDRSVR